MLKKGQHHTPTFLEGTSGLYQRRESPPNIPATTGLFFNIFHFQFFPVFSSNAVEVGSIKLSHTANVSWQ
jgi:hypothetical protein